MKNITESMRVNPKYIKETMEEYNREHPICKKTIKPYPIHELNGGRYYVVDMTAEEFAEQNNAINIEDIQWTQS